MPLAEKSLLLDGQVIGDRIIVVGERGHILISADQGRSWQQQQVPTRATLTSVFFVDPDNGWAAGHDGVILQTRDGGQHWQQVYADPEDERPILDLWFRDPEYGYAVGAYGLFLETEDGGASWEPVDFDPATLAAAEAGADVPTTEAAGEEPAESTSTSTRSPVPPVAASLSLPKPAISTAPTMAANPGSACPPPTRAPFTAPCPLTKGWSLAFGLRGHLFRSADAGNSWTAVETGTQATLNDGISPERWAHRSGRPGRDPAAQRGQRPELSTARPGRSGRRSPRFCRPATGH